MQCPWPVLRLGRAARELGPGASIRIIADDPVAPGELAQLCRERGWRIEDVPGETGCWDVVTA
jgi:tRNA 2-thiouridine synthesizing protein A